MSVKLVSVTEKSRPIFEITVKIGPAKRTFDVSIVDNHGVFGIECQGEMEHIFHNAPAESRALIAGIKQKYLALKKLPELQAA